MYAHEPVVCRDCGAESVASHPIDGTGTVYASTVIRVPGSGVDRDEPFSVALVDVGHKETVRVTGRIDGTPDLEPGNEVVFVPEGDLMFSFKPAGTEHR